MGCHLLVADISGVVIHETGHAHQRSVLFRLTNGITKYAALEFGGRRGNEASLGIAELRVYRCEHGFRRAEPLPVTARAIERNKGLAHRQRIVKKRSASILRIVAKCTARRQSIGAGPA